MTAHLLIAEFCAENFTNIPLAIAAGAKRVELCDNLAVGGTTPSYGVIRRSIRYAKARGVPIMTMIRPRGGNFEYDNAEADIMLDDIANCSALGSTGVVLGALKNGWIDENLLQKFINAAETMEITFHMAFDMLESERQFAAIDWLADHGIKRILTHGGKAQQPIEANLPHLKNLIEYAANRITIVPGAGINFMNINQICTALSIVEAHGSRIIDLQTALPAIDSR